MKRTFSEQTCSRTFLKKREHFFERENINLKDKKEKKKSKRNRNRKRKENKKPVQEPS